MAEKQRSLDAAQRNLDIKKRKKGGARKGTKTGKRAKTPNTANDSGNLW
jgi:hypothetical protein